LKTIYYLFIGFSIVILAVLFFILKELDKKPYSLEIDAIKDKTDISGTLVKVTNTGTNPYRTKGELGKRRYSKHGFIGTRTIIFLLS
jgi:hypothetical protein